MAATLFLIFGLSFCALIGLLAIQMRALTARALLIAAQDRFDGVDRGEIMLGVKASPLEATLEGASGEVQTWLRETYPPAIGHLKLARTFTRVTPFLLLGVVVIWRFGFGGEL